MEMPLKTHTRKLTHFLKYGALAGAVLFALALGAFGSQSQEPRAAEAGTNQIEAVALNQSLCIALGSAFGGLAAIDAAFGCQGATIQEEFQVLVHCLNKTRYDGAPDTLACPDPPPRDPALPNEIFRPDPNFFNGLDLDKNQIFAVQPYLIIAYVADDAPVRFTTEKGIFQRHDGVAFGKDYFCEAGRPDVPPAFLDPDCDGDATTIGDGVVVARLQIDEGDGNSGTFGVRAIQEGVAFPMELTITGTPEKITLAPLFGKDTIQTGATPPTPGTTCEAIRSNNPDLPQDPGLCQEPDSTDCNFGATADAVLGAVGQAEKTIIVAKALDENNVEVVGALINWSLQAGFPDDIQQTTPANGTFVFGDNRFDTGGVALGQTPTLDTGALGVAFPQFVCGGKDPGTIDLVAWFATSLASASDTDEHAEVSINVIGPAEDMALTVAPASIDCNGTNTATVTATVTNAAGDPVANGLDVNFSVVALGTTSPLVADTTDGVASTVVTPLSSAANTGVTVNVSVRGQIDINEDIDPLDDPSAVEHQTWELINRSILVGCTGAPPPPGADPGAGGAAPPPPSGTISPPDTGTGGQRVAGMPVSALVALAGAAAALAATRLAVRNR